MQVHAAFDVHDTDAWCNADDLRTLSEVKCELSRLRQLALACVTAKHDGKRVEDKLDLDALKKQAVYKTPLVRELIAKCLALGHGAFGTFKLSAYQLTELGRLHWIDVAVVTLRFAQHYAPVRAPWKGACVRDAGNVRLTIRVSPTLARPSPQRHRFHVTLTCSSQTAPPAPRHWPTTPRDVCGAKRDIVTQPANTTTGAAATSRSVKESTAAATRNNITPTTNIIYIFIIIQDS